MHCDTKLISYGFYLTTVIFDYHYFKTPPVVGKAVSMCIIYSSGQAIGIQSRMAMCRLLMPLQHYELMNQWCHVTVARTTSWCAKCCGVWNIQTSPSQRQRGKIIYAHKASCHDNELTSYPWTSAHPPCVERERVNVELCDKWDILAVGVWLYHPVDLSLIHTGNHQPFFHLHKAMKQ